MLPAKVDRAVWEEITKGRAGIRWDNVVERNNGRIQGETKKRHCLQRSLAGTRQKKQRK